MQRVYQLVRKQKTRRPLKKNLGLERNRFCCCKRFDQSRGRCRLVLVPGPGLLLLARLNGAHGICVLCVCVCERERKCVCVPGLVLLLLARLNDAYGICVCVFMCVCV